MGYDAQILKGAENPVWNFQEGYDDFLEAWKNPQNPQSWMQHSCIWFSNVLTWQLGLDNIKSYLSILNYGNQDMSAGLTKPAWVRSSLKISPREQVDFIQKMNQGKLPVSTYAVRMTKESCLKKSCPMDGGYLEKQDGAAHPIKNTAGL